MKNSGSILSLGLVLVVLAGALWLSAQHKNQAVTLIRQAPLVTIAEALKAPTGLVAVRGIAHPEQERPLMAQASGLPCLYCDLTVWQEAWVWDDDEENPGQVKEQRRVEQVVDSRPFRLEDATGNISVNPRHAQMDQLVVALDVYEPLKQSEHLAQVKRRSDPQTNWSSEGKVTGYRYTEKILPPERTIFVVGQVQRRQPQQDRVELRAQSVKDPELLISMRSPDEAMSSLKAQATAAFLGAVVLGAAGLGCLGYGAIDGLNQL
ncbi:MAG: GIDE domain-containing protein [Cyanobacteria bacterium P01_G01_bin.54]